ncbi:MAG: type II toxin-antitoxin system RelE/ParE family toxin [Thermomicrobiales bacterium]|jgi:proteic killer suppression protein|nr:type II toxin-antitoxin system RelE/ParE family toxin [Thermomicrobiales bacterium]
MIESFKHKGLKQLYEKGDRSGLGAAMVPRIQEILTILDVAKSIEELNIPGYRLHPLTGSLAGCWSIRVTGNRRIVFRFVDGSAQDVDLVDYH